MRVAATDASVSTEVQQAAVSGMTAGYDYRLPALMPALTGLRGVASVWVVLFHGFRNFATPFTSMRMAEIPFLDLGFLGVDVFFMLSGFILSHVHANDFLQYSGREHLRFLKLRLARIYPLHVFYLVAFATAVVGLPNFADAYSGNRLSGANFVSALLLVHNWGFGPATPLWNGPTWSLSAEWLAYIGFPILTVGIHKLLPRPLAIPLSIALLTALVTLTIATGHSDLGGIGKPGLLRMAAEFTTGCLLHRAMTDSRQSFLRASWLFWIAGAVTALSLSTHSWHWMSVFGFMLLIPSLVTPNHFASFIFANPIAVFLGDISFSLYLCHWPLIQVHNWIFTRYSQQLGQTGQGFLAVGLLAFIVLLSLATWQWVEKPSRRYFRQFIK